MTGKRLDCLPPPALPTAGTDAYWRVMREGFALLRNLREVLKIAAGAPTYVRGRWNEEEEDYEIDENCGPFEVAADAIQEAWCHPYASRVMVAWGFNPDDLCTDYHTLYRRFSARLS